MWKLHCVTDTRSWDTARLGEWIRTSQPNSWWLWTPANGSLPIYSQIDLQQMVWWKYQAQAMSLIWDYFDIWLDANQMSSLIDSAYWDQWHNPEITPLDIVSERDNLYSLHLWHWPTYAFKNVALEFLSRYLAIVNKETLTALWASSWDTINAAHHSVNWIDSLRSIFLLPQNWPSEVQTLLATANDIKNAMTILIDWDFDEAQDVIKRFNSPEYSEFKNKNNFISFNSIQILRIIAQIVYYFRAYTELVHKGIIKMWDEVNFSVPSANFWDALAWFYAKQMWLPINKINIATNSNDMLHRFFECWEYRVELDNSWNRKKAYQTIAPSQDITVSSNFERVLFWAAEWDCELVKSWFDDLKTKWSFKVSDTILNKIRQHFTSSSASDSQIISTQQEVYKEYWRIISTHSATWYKPYLHQKPVIPTVCLETDHSIQIPTPEWVPQSQDYSDEIDLLKQRWETIQEWKDYLTSSTSEQEIKAKVEEAIYILNQR